MPTTDLGWTGLVASLVLVAAAVAASVAQRLRLEREIIVACTRGVVQLGLVGWALVFVLDPQAPIWWAWAWAVGIAALASRRIARRAPALPGVLPAAVAGHGLSMAAAFGVAFGLGVFPHEARVIVPVTGMVVGNAMRASVVAARRLQDEIADKRLEVEARLALGWSAADAIRPAVRAALRLGLLPTIETVRNLGLIFLPGAMTGLILAGTDPQEAVLVQLALMFLILGSSAVTATTVTWVTSARLFTPDLRPIVIARSVADEGR